MAKACSNYSCQNPGTLICARCKGPRYCSQDCQRSQWSVHKAACKTSSQSTTPKKSNCYIIRAAPQTANDAPVVPNNIASQIVPFHLSHYGDEAQEKRQLGEHLGWEHSIEVGKFYDHVGTDDWYYYVYGDERALDPQSGAPLNEAAGLVCHQRLIYGDVAVVRSGPMGSTYAEEFPESELAAAVRFYRTNDRNRIFRQREKSRFERNCVWHVDSDGWL